MELYQLISEITILVLSLFCGFFALRLYLYIKGGELANAWRYLAGAAFFFAIYQLIYIINELQIIEMLTVPIWILQLIKIIFILFLTLGFFVYKRTLI